ncbi:hypothetical protein [Mycolicibacterium fallax]|uniref:Uncharacterized protein n=1 Tax=Mycolicibacterium fallax TaxID=1793 RepID=A0A1X1RFS4_MYCFA|nr:hypothetical protein [Mycolicibacterium fallax]ORV04773.1 hypothetical protein AWC04_07620 [Mycolicibacterium fallax]BBY97632.1 hypothetical protein MFAL_10990 [Mycolicibacterium fallax]HOW93191.1 hypothetical protein [Mycolicibacterium fallax]
MRKIALLTGGCAAVVAMAVLGTGSAAAEAPDVVGETFATASAILKSQGYKAQFGGAIGHDLPQSQCMVVEQTAAGRMQRLRLDCNLAPGQTQPAAPNTHRLVPQGGSMPGLPDGNGASRPTPGAGTVTVVPVPVG